MTMDDEHRIEIETLDDETEEEHSEPEEASGEEVDISAAIDEAVSAVEAAEARRQEPPPPAAAAMSGAGEVERLQTEIATLRDHSLRTLADFDNFRKRVERERGEERKYAAVELLREVLGIVDNLERALSAEGNLDDLKQGVEMIRRQMNDLLERSGVTRVEAVEQEFDPSVHEAVSRVEDPDVEHPTVIEEFQPGYIVHDRLLRPSIVRVAVPASQPAADVPDHDSTEEQAEEAAD